MNRGGLATAAAGALAVYCGVLAFILLSPSPAVAASSVAYLGEIGRALHAPDWMLIAARVEFMANATIAAPVSFLGSVVFRDSTWRDWTAYLFVTSGLIELVQGALLPGRSATFVDMVANTLGALMGAVLMLVIRRVRSL